MGRGRRNRNFSDVFIRLCIERFEMLHLIRYFNYHLNCYHRLFDWYIGFDNGTIINARNQIHSELVERDAAHFELFNKESIYYSSNILRLIGA